MDFFLASKQVIGILDWAPARLTAFTYAIAGSFEDALNGWRSFHESRFAEFSNNASGILICTGSGALRLPSLLTERLEYVNDYRYLVKAAIGLVWRSLLVWLILLAIFTLASWT
jgi:membrane protein required for beta-lactamase induction